MIRLLCFTIVDSDVDLGVQVDITINDRETQQSDHSLQHLMRSVSHDIVQQPNDLPHVPLLPPGFSSSTVFSPTVSLSALTLLESGGVIFPMGVNTP